MDSIKEIKCKVCGSNRANELYSNLMDDRYGCDAVVSIYECDECGYKFTYPFISDDELPSLYENYYPRNSELVSQIRAQNPNLTFSQRIKHYILGTDNQAQFVVRANSKYLDVGSGSCGGALQAKSMGCDVWTIEADPSAIKFAKEFKLNHHCGMLKDVPDNFNNFDLIAYNQVLEHVTNPVSELLLANELLKRNGKIFISVPNSNSLFAKISGRNWINWHVPFHISHFSKDVLRRILNDSGYQIEKFYTKTPNLWLKIQILRFLNLDKALIWDRQRINKSDLPKRIFPSIKRRIILGLISILVPFIARLIDIIGLGESICVLAKKTNKT